jgi:DNA-binding transcriptional LysR family regulator
LLENYRLAVFRAVAAQHSFRRSAEQLYLTQPAVTQQIKALEELIGLPLSDRSGRDVTLTAAGDLLLRYAKESGAVLERGVIELDGHLSGTLRIAASTTIAQYILPPLLGAFLRLHPAVRVELDSSNTESVADAIATGRAALGLVEGPPHSNSSTPRSASPLPSCSAPCWERRQARRSGLTVTLFLIGTGISKATLRKVGVRPMLQGIALWIIIATLALWAIRAHLIAIGSPSTFHSRTLRACRPTVQ